MLLDDLVIEEIVRRAIKEDLGSGDLTGGSLVAFQEGSGKFMAREAGLITGLPILKKVFSLLNNDIYVQFKVSEGSKIDAGTEIAVLQGPLLEILQGERVALNFLQRMSGIATRTSKYVELVKDYPAQITDTRKTVPGLRLLDKYAVRTGGGVNHRFGLSDMVLVKENHIRAVGSITEAVRRLKACFPFRVKIEVEVENLIQLQEAAGLGVDIIMLDNMSPREIEKAVNITSGRGILLEASGNINEQTVVSVAETGVDFISIGELTHSAKAMDITFLLD